MDYSSFTFQHSRVGKSECDGTKLAIRWNGVIPEKRRLNLLEDSKLKLIEMPVESDNNLSKATINNTDTIWWVENIKKEPVPDTILAKLEKSRYVAWISPVFKGERTASGIEGLFTVNPARFYLNQLIVTKMALSELAKMGLKISINEKRSAMLKKLTALVIENVSLTNKISVIQVAQKIGEIFLDNKQFKYSHDFHFENIPFISPTCAEFVPNDPSFSSEWGMWRINAPYAWNVTRGDLNIIVAVLDQGVELNHPDINVYSQSWNTSDDTPDGSPVGRHGTACAGIIGAKINNATGVAGLAGECQIMAIAMSTISDIDVAEGLYFAADNGARVVSMSFGQYPWWGSWDFDIIRDALQYAHDKGLVLVAASGNEDLSQCRFPGSDPLTICVGGSNRDDLRKSVNDTSIEPNWGACYGDSLDVVAPCLEIPTTDLLGTPGYDPGDYTMSFGGTSAATPHVAALAALILSIKPSLSNEEVREIIERTCDKISPSVYSYSVVSNKPNGTRNTQVGYGRINVERAINLASQLKEGEKTDSLKEVHWKRHKHTVAVIKAERKSLDPLLRKTALDRIFIGTFPWGVAFDGSYIWVVNSGSDTVSKIDIVNNTVVATVAVGHRPEEIAFDGTHIWVTNNGADSVSKIDVVTNAVVATIAVGKEPQGIVFDGAHIWIAEHGSNSVRKLEITTHDLRGLIDLGYYSIGPRELTFDGTHIWVIVSKRYGWYKDLYKINYDTNAIMGSIKVGNVPQQLVFDGKYLWVADLGSSDVYKIDISTNTVITSVKVGTGSYGLAFDGIYLWVSNYYIHNLSKIDVNTDSVIKTVGVWGSPVGIAFDGTHIWVASMCMDKLCPPAHCVTKIPALSLGNELPSSVLT